MCCRSSTQQRLNKLKPIVMSLCKAFLFVISISIATAAVAPNRWRRDERWVGGRIDDHSKQWCKELPLDIAQYCGYNHTYFLYDEGHHKKDFQEADREFRHFTRLINSNCSSYLGTLLCFYYFPLSNCGDIPEQRLKFDLVSVFPCRETCDAAKNGTCKALARTQQDTSNWDWPDQFQDCTDFRPSAAGTACSYGEKTKPFVTIPKPLPTVSSVTTAATEEPTTTCSCTSEVSCPKTCSFRNNLSRKTFRDTSNNGYTYALKATVISAIEANTFTAQVIEGYDVSSCVNNSVQPLKDVGQTITICVPCAKSDKLSVVVGQTVVIGGTHTVNGDCYTYSLNCNVHKPLLGVFKNKYDLKAYANEGKCKN